jgi:hypothetical protein
MLYSTFLVSSQRVRSAAVSGSACTSELRRAPAGGQEPKLLPVLESSSLLRLGFEYEQHPRGPVSQTSTRREVKADADLLLRLADECDRGLLCVAEWRSALPYLKNEQPPKVGEAKAPFEWDPLNDRR